MHTAIDKLIIKLIKSKLDGITSILKHQSYVILKSIFLPYSAQGQLIRIRNVEITFYSLAKSACMHAHRVAYK